MLEVIAFRKEITVTVRSFPLTLRVTVSEATPDDIRTTAVARALEFFGSGTELDVISAEAEPDQEREGHYCATVVFRKVA
ncbi:hypothetical protein [Nonomuraea sp. B19D2]|uniref:hypothetical protein n=1 Tax=Nonomuraea sp. B19D2 TaxID=3159561 RepID=UPI0032DB40AD